MIGCVVMYYMGSNKLETMNYRTYWKHIQNVHILSQTELIVLNTFLSYTYHGFLDIFVVRVPANAHHHFVQITVTDAGPAIIDPCADI